MSRRSSNASRLASLSIALFLLAGALQFISQAETLFSRGTLCAVILTAAAVIVAIRGVRPPSL